jgi:hypothetical protein
MIRSTISRVIGVARHRVDCRQRGFCVVMPGLRGGLHLR